MACSGSDTEVQQRNVVIAVDNSENSEWAFDWYCENFFKPGQKVILLHIPDVYVNATTMSAAKVAEYQNNAEAKTKALRDKFIQSANKRNITAEFKVEAGDKPGQVICEVAQKTDAVFVVTGTRGMGKFRRTVLGSVSDFVVHHAHCPVLVARHKDK